MDREELLAQLRDIHLPEPVSWWPLAFGWWLLAALLLAAATLALYYGGRILHSRYLRQRALAELARVRDRYPYTDTDGDPETLKLRYVNGVNTVLRRVALFHFPGSAAGSLSGADWVGFIRDRGDASLLDEQMAEALSSGRFQTRCEVDTEALHRMAYRWISSLYRYRRPWEGANHA